MIEALKSRVHVEEGGAFEAWERELGGHLMGLIEVVTVLATEVS